MFHKLFVSDKGAMELYNGALKDIDEMKKAAVKKEYKKALKKLKLDYKKIEKIAVEEAAAAYWEEIFDIPGVWEYVLSGKPTLKDKTVGKYNLI